MKPAQEVAEELCAWFTPDNEPIGLTDMAHTQEVIERCYTDAYNAGLRTAIELVKSALPVGEDSAVLIAGMDNSMKPPSLPEEKQGFPRTHGL
jgi:hypothetical protein